MVDSERKQYAKKLQWRQPQKSAREHVSGKLLMLSVVRVAVVAVVGIAAAVVARGDVEDAGVISWPY